jgi:hypothetical protein
MTKQQYTTLLSEYLRIKYNLYQNTYIRRGGKGYFVINGEEVPAEKWQSKNVLPDTLILGKPNPDSTRSWRYNKSNINETEE